MAAEFGLAPTRRVGEEHPRRDKRHAVHNQTCPT
jgi:hypothetical protein